MTMLCAIPFAGFLFAACAAPQPLAVGYVEGEYVSLAPVEAGEVLQVKVRRGDHVEAGETLAQIEAQDAKIAVTKAKAALSEAHAQLANLEQGKRPAEIEVLKAAVSSAQAEYTEAQRVLSRTRDLFQGGTASRAQLDKAQTSHDQAKAKLGEAKANLAVARLPARPQEIKAARERCVQAREALEQAKWRLAQRTIKAPAEGRVEDIIRNPGDIAGPSAPVISMLPKGAVKLKVYIPEPDFSSVQVGTVLDVRCDGCPPGLEAEVSYVSQEPEFTPPVIYSLEMRQKLVYLVEARPKGEEASQILQPGQIVDVAIGEAGKQLVSRR